MERTIFAYSLMALFVVAGLIIGLHLRHNSRERSLQREIARQKFQRQARAVADGRE